MDDHPIKQAQDEHSGSMMPASSANVVIE